MNNNKTTEASSENIVICDFDGTVTEQDVCDEIMAEFSNDDWRTIGEAYEKGLISHQEMNSKFIESLKVTPEALNQFLSTRIQIRNGFFEFARKCNLSETPIIIVSGGWDSYIREALSGIDIFFPKKFAELCGLTRSRIAVVCNTVSYDGNNVWNINFPDFGDSKNCTPDKRAVVNHFNSIGKKHVAVIGNGATDQEMALVADSVFARGSLARFCKERDVDFKEFTSFNDIDIK